MGFRMVKIFLTSDDPYRSDSNISRDVLFCLQNSVLFPMNFISAFYFVVLLRLPSAIINIYATHGFPFMGSTNQEMPLTAFRLFFFL